MDLADIFQKESKSLFNGAFITVTVVRVSPDLSFAKVFLSVLNPNKKEVLEQVKAAAKDIRKILAIRVKQQLRKVPELVFVLDDSLDYYEEIDKLLKK